MSDVLSSGRFSDALYPTVALGVGLSVWWVVVTALDIPSFLFPSPVAVGEQLATSPDLYLRNAVATLMKILYGGSVGAVGGFALGVAVAMAPWFRRAVYPYLVTVRVLPKIAVAPLLLIYLGTGTITAVVFVALIAFFPAVLSTAAGFDRMPAEQRDLCRSVGASPIDAFVRVRLPYALPDVFAGLKQSVTLAVIGAVVAEWLVADSGLGFLILLASENLRTDLMLAALVVLVLEGLGLYAVIMLIQRAVPFGPDVGD